MAKEDIKQFKKGDSVVMHSCHEAKLEQYKGKVWKCLTDSSSDKGGAETVFLEGFSGSFFCEYLLFVNPNL